MVSFTENSGVGLLAEGVAMLFMKKSEENLLMLFS